MVSKSIIVPKMMKKVNNMTHEEYARFQRALQFAENHRPSGGFSNIYVLRTSINGVPNREYYGMNVMTNYGFEKFFRDKSTFPTNLYVGYGTDLSTNFYTNPEITNVSTTTPATVIRSALNTDAFFKYPMWYDSTTGLISLICKYLECYYPDQTSGGPPAELTITEYGIGSAINQLWTRSWLYDIQGDRVTNFHKEPNERLDIEVYFVLTYNKSLIEDGWNNGKYCALTTMYRFIRQHMGYDDTSSYTYRRYNTTVDRGCSSRIIDIGTNSNATQITTQQEFELMKSTGDANGYLDGFIQKSSGFICCEPQLQTASPEAVNITIKPRWQQSYFNRPKDSNGNYINSNTGGANITSTSNNELFGHPSEQSYPFTNLVIPNNGVALYNYNTRRYDNPTQFVNDSDHYYTETPMSNVCSVPIYYTNTTTGNIIEAYLHVNVSTNDPILKFENGNVAIYATDQYWSRGSWQLIEYEHFSISDNKDGQQPFAENYSNGYFVKNDWVCVPRKSIKWTITNLGNSVTDVRHWTYGPNVVSINGSYGSNSAKYFVTNLSEVLDDTIPGDAITTNQYSFYDTTNGFSTNVTNLLTRTYCTESTSGLLGFQSTEADEFVVMYIADERTIATTNRHKFTSRMGCCIIDSTKNRIAFFYQNKIYVKQYNMTTSQWTDTHEYDLPSGYAEPTLMFGLRDKLWVTNGSSYMICYDLESTISGEGTACASRVPLATNRNDSHFIELTAVDEVIVVYKWRQPASPNIRQAYYVQYDDPLNTYQIPYQIDSVNYENTRMYMKLKKIRTNTIALVCGSRYSPNYAGSFRAIADFGKYLHPPVDTSIATDISWDREQYDVRNVANRSGIYTFGPNYLITEYGFTPATENTVITHCIPIEYALTHAISGTTKTISAINNIRHVSGKQWSTEVTNIKDTNYGDSGKPPGASN